MKKTFLEFCQSSLVHIFQELSSEDLTVTDEIRELGFLQEFLLKFYYNPTKKFLLKVNFNPSCDSSINCCSEFFKKSPRIPSQIPPGTVLEISSGILLGNSICNSSSESSMNCPANYCRNSFNASYRTSPMILPKILSGDSSRNFLLTFLQLIPPRICIEISVEINSKISAGIPPRIYIYGFPQEYLCGFFQRFLQGLL